LAFQPFLKGIAMDHSLDRTHAMHPAAEPQVRQVALDAPVQWLRLGARDLHRSLGSSLTVGVAVAVAGCLLLAATWRVAYLAPALLGGFLFVAPFAAIAVYGITRQLERGEPIDEGAARGAWQANAQSIA
jgi:uncharacterized membrane protein